MKVLVVGAGIIGNFVAATLVSRGITVDLADCRESPFSGSSRAAFGSLTPFSDPFFRGEARRFAAESVDRYRNYWIPEFRHGSGVAVTFQDEGLLQLCGNKDDLDHYRDNIEQLSADGYQVRVLTPAETRHIEPALTGDFEAAIWMDEPWLDKDELFLAITKYLSSSPLCTLRYSTEVTNITDNAHGQLSVGFVSREAELFDFVVLCTGLMPGTSLQRLPLAWIRGDCVGVTTTTNRPILRRHVYMHSGFITPRDSGYMLLGATYIQEEGPPASFLLDHCDQIEVGQVMNLLSSNSKILPALKDCELVRTWRGWRPTLPDELPILGPSRPASRIIIANGFIGLGLTMAPAVGDAIAKYISFDDTTGFPSSFSPLRLGGLAELTQ